MNEKLKLLQASLLENLLEIDRICSKHNLRYYLYWGTLLGAIRHQGFIPWDDDADIAMPRRDYEKFLRIAEHELREDFFIQWYKTEKYYRHPFAKLRKNNTACIIPQHAHIRMHQGIFVDIFPLDDVPKHKITSWITWYIPRCLDRVCALCTTRLPRKLRFLIPFQKIIQFVLPVRIPAFLANWVASRFKPAYATQWRCTFEPERTTADKMTVPVAWFAQSERKSFEGKALFVPCGYDSILTRMYDDYMTPPPVEKQKPVHSDGGISTTEDYKTFLPQLYKS